MSSTINNTSYLSGEKGFYDNKVANSSVKYGRNAIKNYKSYVRNLTQPLPKVPLSEIRKLSTLSTPAEYRDRFQKLVEVEGQKTADDSMDKLREEMCEASSKGLIKRGFSPEDEKKFDELFKTVGEKIDATTRALKKIPMFNFELSYLPGRTTYKSLNKMSLMGASFEDLGKRVSVSVQEMTQNIQEKWGSMFTAKAFDVDENGEIDISENATALLMKDMLSTDPEGMDARNIDGRINNKGNNAFLNYCTMSAVKSTKDMCRQLQILFNLKDAQNSFTEDPNNMI